MTGCIHSRVMVSSGSIISYHIKVKKKKAYEVTDNQHKEGNEVKTGSTLQE